MLTVMIAPAHGVSPPYFAVLINVSAGAVMVIIVILTARVVRSQFQISR